MSHSEFRAWQAFQAQEPFPATFQREFAGAILPLVGNGFGGKANDEAFVASDFLRNPWQPIAESREDADNTSFEALQRFLGGHKN